MHSSLLKITELPKALQDDLARELHQAIPLTIVANPYFDDVIIFYGNTVPTLTDRYAPLICNECNRLNIYEKKVKETKTDYIESIKSRLLKKPNPAWPFKGRLLVQFSVSDTLSRLKKVDLDNLAKAILDSLQGVVFENDAQIYSLYASKDFVNGKAAHIIAIRQLDENEKPKIQDFVFSTSYRTWRKEYYQKNAVGKPTHIDHY